MNWILLSPPPLSSDPDNPQNLERALAQKTCPGGRDLTFESCPGAGNSTRAGILWKMKLKLRKNSVDQISTGENTKTKKKQVEVLTFFEVYVLFSTEFFLVYGSIFYSTVTHTLQKSEELPLACLFEVFTGLWLSTLTFCIKSYDYV